VTEPVTEAIPASELDGLHLRHCRVVVCDLDGTLADSKVPGEPAMLRAIERLLDVMDVGIISGGRRRLIDFQVVSRLELTPERRSHLHLLPASGTRYLRWRSDAWRTLVDEPLTPDAVTRAEVVLTEVSQQLGLWEQDPAGDVMDDRGGQLTYSVLGQEAESEVKKAWDPDGSKKDRIIELAQPRLPDLLVSAGKSTSIDVTRLGYDKGFGVQAVLGELDVPPQRALFFGDRLDAGGNDRPVLRTGVPCVQVEHWRETLGCLERLADVAEGQRRVSDDSAGRTSAR
jgi:HAD superfamily hydrolase (TIGR01484 family)